MNNNIKISGLGWVLPTGSGAGNELLDRADWIEPSQEDHGALTDFSARDYLNSVKGYLDPAGACCLAASALALGNSRDELVAAPLDDVGVVTITHFGAPKSGYRFYEQLLMKGSRLASPLLFPHGYSNTAGNLVAIEFGFGGPHMVFYGNTDVREAFDFAATQILQDRTRHMLVSAYEASIPNALPDSSRVLNGAATAWLSGSPEAPEILAFNHGVDRSNLDICNLFGSVHAMVSFLRAMRDGNEPSGR